MDMKSKAGIALIGLTLVSGAQAAEFNDYARVLSVTPQVERFNQPEEQCRIEYVPVEREASRGAGGAVIGGLAGALLGHQVGRGHGKTAATAAGAVTGAIVGDRIQNRDRGTTVTEQEVRRCHTVDRWQERVTGYAVQYEYNGREYSAVMPHDPGRRLRLHVSIEPES